MEKHRPVARVTRRELEKNMKRRPTSIRNSVIRNLNLDMYDAIEGLMTPYQPGGDTLITFLYMGSEHTLPRNCVELISRYEVD